MEFWRFLHAILLLPAQIVRSGRRIIYRIMGHNSYLKDFLAIWKKLRRMAPTSSSDFCHTKDAKPPDPPMADPKRPACLRKAKIAHFSHNINYHIICFYCHFGPSLA
jgi:hypothetical protein